MTDAKDWHPDDSKEITISVEGTLPTSSGGGSSSDDGGGSGMIMILGGVFVLLVGGAGAFYFLRKSGDVELASDPFGSDAPPAPPVQFAGYGLPTAPAPPPPPPELFAPVGPLPPLFPCEGLTGGVFPDPPALAAQLGKGVPAPPPPPDPPDFA